MARIYIDIGDAMATDPHPTGAWDLASWDTDAALWAGTMPSWTEISCRVRSVRIDRGRRGVLEIFEPGRAVISVDNSDGWASWSPTSPGPVAVGAWLRVRADEQVLFTGGILRIADAYDPAGDISAELVVVDPLARLGQIELPATVPAGAGETAAERIGRVLDLIGQTPELRSLDPGGPLLTATTLAGSMADQAQRAAVTAGGALFADRDARICYRDADWLRTSPRSVDPQAVVANDGRPGALCSTGMEANGPDMERVVNRATYSGVDDADPDAEPEISLVDGSSTMRYGPASWKVDQLYTTDLNQLSLLASRVLAMRAAPRVWMDSLTLSPIADPDAARFCSTVDLGDRMEIHYLSPLGWGWSFDVHVHGIAYRIYPSGVMNEAREWSTTLTLDDASYWLPGDQWDYAEWDTAQWSDPALLMEHA